MERVTTVNKRGTWTRHCAVARCGIYGRETLHQRDTSCSAHGGRGVLNTSTNDLEELKENVLMKREIIAGVPPHHGAHMMKSIGQGWALVPADDIEGGESDGAVDPATPSSDRPGPQRPLLIPKQPR